MREPEAVEPEIEVERTARVASAAGRMMRSDIARPDIESDLRAPARPTRRATMAPEPSEGDRLRPAHQQPRSGTVEARNYRAVG